MKKRTVLLPVIVICLASVANGQEKWDLRRCVEYAWENNISIKQSDIQARIAAVTLKQNKWAQYPTANFSNSTGLQFGRSIDPTTNQFTSNQFLSQTFSLSAGFEIYNWGRITHAITAASYEADAALADVEKNKNDIALNVATYYLQVLLSRQQIDIARVQMEQTRSQYQLTRKKVDAGAVPELDALSLEGQYANDSSNVISAQATADNNLLQLKGLLNVDAGLPFDVETPPIEQIPVEPILQLLPESVFDIAMKNQPAQKANALRLKSLGESSKSVRANFYPSFSVGGGLGTNFANSIKGQTFNKIWDGWGTQINTNFRQNLGLSISVPILNGGSAKFGYEKAKLNYKNAEITIEQTNQKLKNDIYQAYYNASAALEKYNATQKTVSAAQKTFDFASKRYELGLLNIFDLLTSQNNLTKAKYDMAYARFDYVFKMKVLEFYKGLGIRLK
ncbi:MAG: TolC family protein [Chitinophagaceae bacterium]